MLKLNFYVGESGHHWIAVDSEFFHLFPKWVKKIHFER